MLEGLELADEFLHVSSYGWGQDFDSLNDTIGVNNKTSPHLNPGVFVIDAIYSAEIN